MFEKANALDARIKDAKSKVQMNQGKATTTVELAVTGIQHAKCPCDRGDLLILSRERDNVYDENAIQVQLMPDSSTPTSIPTSMQQKVGYVSRQEAQVIAPYLDDASVCIQAASKIDDGSHFFFPICVSMTGPKAEALAQDLATMQASLDASMMMMSKLCISCPKHSDDVANVDHELALKCGLNRKTPRSSVQPSFKIPSSEAATIEQDSIETFGIMEDSKFTHLGWIPYNESKCQSSKCQSSSSSPTQSQWPPSDDLLMGLGLAPSNDHAWYNKYHLKAPVLWKVNAAQVLQYPSSSSSSSSTLSSNDNDDDARLMLGIEPWTEEFLKELMDFLSDPKTRIWSHVGTAYQTRKRDQLIATFGAPYILGQKDDELVVAHCQPHCQITQSLCRGKNIIHAVMHLKHVQTPGFNTIVFGLAWRGSGFSYHRDQIRELQAKDVPLCENQAVSTTVLYEKPQLDSGKETVCWLPLKGWKYYGASYDNPYLAKYQLQTFHGTEHVQSSGLQNTSKHGVVHTLGTGVRQGARIAVTARICYLNATERVNAAIDKGYYSYLIGGQNELLHAISIKPIQ